MIKQKQIEGFPSMTRAELNAAAAANQLKEGKVYLITDENRLSFSLTTSAYEATATESDLGDIDSVLSAILGI